jgi:flagellin
MAIRINSNLAATRAQKDLSRAQRDSQLRQSRLASGLHVVKASDGAGQLSVSEGMRAEIGGLVEGTRNTEKAMDLLRVAEGGMSEVSAILVRMRELAVEGASDTLNDENRKGLDAEFSELKEYIDRIAKLASYNGQNLLSGFGNEVDAAASTALVDSAATGLQRIQLAGAQEGVYTFIDSGADDAVTLGNGVATQTVFLGARLDDGQVAAGTALVANFDQLGVEMTLAGDGVKGMRGSYANGDLDGRTMVVAAGTGGTFQLGSNAVPADRLEYDIRDLTVAGGIIDLAQVGIQTRSSSRSALLRLDQAIVRTARERGAVGAVLNRLENTLSFASNSIENLQASEATVRDADYAWETSILSRDQILLQSSTAAMVKSRMPVDMVMTLLQ